MGVQASVTDGKPLEPKARVLWLVLMNAAWALGYPFTAVVLSKGHVSPSLLTAVRIGGAALIMAPFLRRVTWSKAIFVRGLWLGTLGFAVPIWLQIRGLGETDPAIAAVSVALEPLLTTLWAALVDRQRVTRWQYGALMMAVMGSWVLTGLPRPGHLKDVAGDLMLILSVVVFALYNVYSPRLSRDLDASGAAALSFLMGFVASAAIWLIGGAPLPSAVSWSVGLSGGYLAVMGTGLAYWLWLYVTRDGSVTVSALFLFIQPLFGSLLAIMLGQVALSVALVAGGLTILVAMYLGQESPPFGRDRGR